MWASIYGKSSSTQKKPKELKQEDRVIVRIWLPKVGGQSSNAYKAVAKIYQGKEANVGHVSVEAHGSYASLWPHPSDPITSLFQVVKPNFHDLSDDENAESNEEGVKKECDITFCFYSLGASAINDAFDEVKKSNVGYTLTGDSSLADGEGQSCCSLALCLLKRGGLGSPDVLPLNESSTTVVLEPAKLCAMLKEAKEQEYLLYSETIGFERLPEEYIPLQKKSSCVLF